MLLNLYITPFKYHNSYSIEEASFYKLTYIKTFKAKFEKILITKLHLK